MPAGLRPDAGSIGRSPLKTSSNIYLINCLVIILAIIFCTAIFYLQVRSETPQFARQEQERAIQTFWHLLQAKGTDFRIVDDKLLAGSYVINGNNELPDRVKEIFGGTATIFMGDTRVSTNVLKDDGSRAIGTRLQGPAYDAIFRHNRPYRGEAPILGATYFTAYDPIRNSKGETIGVLYVGVKKNEFLAAYHRLTSNVVAGSALIGVLLIAIAWGLLRERLQADGKLREMIDRIRLITDSVPVGIAYVDTRMRYLFANRNYEDLFGCACGDLAGKSVREVVGDEFYRTREDNLRKALAGESTVFIHELTGHDGVTRTLQTAYVPHHGEGGRVIGYFVQHYDISEVTRAQEALTASESIYRTVFDTTGAATFLVEDDTTIALVNNEFLRMYGCTREEVEGKLSWTAFVHPADRERMLRYHRDRRDAPGVAPAVYEFDAIRMDGTVRHILAYVNLIPGTRRSVASYLDITERKELQMALGNQLSFLQTLIDAIPSPVFYKDRAGRYTGCNAAFERYLGLAKEDVVGRTVYDLAPRDLADRYFEMDEALFASPGTQVYDASVIYADGSRHEVIFNKATFADQDGRVTGLVGVILDLTDRKRAESAVIAAEEKFRSLVEQSLVGIYIIQDGQFVYVNPKMAEIFGYTRVELVSGIGHLDLTAEEDRPMAAEFVRRRVEGEVQSIQYEFRGLRKDGIVRDIEVYGTGTVYEGRPAVIGTLLDITDRKKAEKALRESEDRFHRIFSQNDDAIILFRLDNFEIIDANPAATILTGYPREELLALSQVTFVERDDFQKLIDKIPMDDLSQAFQLTRAAAVKKDGSRLAVSIRAKILQMRDEYVIYCSIRDMSEKFRLEDEVKTTQARLIQTNKMTSIGMLASSVAHEINNPNNCISVNADMLAEVWRDAEPLLQQVYEAQGDFTLRGIPFSQMQSATPRLLSGISESSRRITAIVNNMRDFVREDKSGLNGSVEVNRLIRNAASILWHHIHVYTDNFRMDLYEPLPPAIGNWQQIEQVIINLLMNALQSLPDKKSGVEVSTSADPETGTVVIVVRDEGKGMDREVVARLREPFFTTKLAEGGTGLGLYISDSIIKEHKGSLIFESIPGQGTTATVILPVHQG